MIDKLSRISQRLHPFRSLSFLVATIFVALFIYAFIELPANEQDRVAMPCLLGVLWAIMFNLFTTIFSHVPQIDKLHAGFFKRWKIKLLRLFYTLFALFFIMLTIIVVILTFKMISVWQGG